MPDGDVTLGEIYRVLLDVKREVSTLGGRVVDHETRLSVLEDRLRDDPRRQGALAGGAAGGAVAGLLGLIDFLRSLWSR